MTKRTSERRRGPAPPKPAKPHPDFPLFAHATRRWAKKVRGKLRYFGPWSDPQGALQKWLDQKDDLLAGRTPRASGDGLTIRDLLNRFLTAKRHQLDCRELSPRSFADYHATSDRISKAFGLTRLVMDLASDDFERLRTELSQRNGPVRLGNEIARTRIIFRFAFEAGLIDRPVRYGPMFKKPSKNVLRRHRAQNGVRMFEAVDIRRMLDAASQPLRAMIFLGCNCGFGNSDCAMLPLKALDLEGGWINFPRPKTGISRRCPLWPETVAALQEWLTVRPTPRNSEHDGLVFITKQGKAWLKATSDNPVSKEMAKLLDRLGLHRPRLGFYTVRHIFRTVADESLDQPAIDLMMGHTRDDMASHYRERIADDRLRRVVDHVRTWLFGQPAREPVVAEPAAIAFDPRPLLLAGVVADLRKEDETK